MRRRDQVNLALAVAVGILIALLWLIGGDNAPSHPLTTFALDDITHVVLGFAHAPSIVLQRLHGNWRLLEPVAAPADRGTVGQILKLAGARYEQQRPLDQVDAAAAGLAPPQVTVTFNQGQPIALGGAAAVAGERYARMGGTVYLISQSDTGALDAEYADLVSRELVPSGEQITKLVLPGATLIRTGQSWTVSPASADPGPDAVRATIDAWRYGGALWMQPADKRPAQARVLVFTTKERIVYEVVAREPYLILRRPKLGVALQVADSQTNALLNMEHPLPPPRLKQSSDIPLVPNGAARGG